MARPRNLSKRLLIETRVPNSSAGTPSSTKKWKIEPWKRSIVDLSAEKCALTERTARNVSLQP